MNPGPPLPIDRAVWASAHTLGLLLWVLVDLEGEYPDYLEETLAYGAAQCAEFNRRGTLLAVGCKTGQIVMYAQVFWGAIPGLPFAHQI